jgi:glycosyltransferase involved in cell wall biosynthesis
MSRSLLSIVIPAFNEEDRLERCLRELHSYFQTREWPAELVVVDDGSTDSTADVAGRTARAVPGMQLQLLRNSQNAGKGYSVRRGLLAARGEHTLITDVDLSTPIEEFEKLYQALADKQAQIAIGSRDLPESDVRVHQSNLRERSGKVFNLLVRGLLRLPFRDTQCGFKIFQTDVSRSLFERQAVNRYSFDVEILLMAREAGLRTVEVPVVWRHDRGSRVRFLRDGLKMILDLGIITAKYWTGGYRPRTPLSEKERV